MSSLLELGIPAGDLQESTADLFRRAGYKITLSSRSYYPVTIGCVTFREGGKDMLQLTDKAAVRLQTALSELDVDEGACYRLALTEEGMKIVIDQEREGDTAVKYGDDVLIVIDATSVGRLEGRTMDFDESARQLIVT
jgi:Fe-S cluster assembly iron-binding protein IscA